MTGIVVVLAIVLVALLWIATGLRRRSLRTYLLAVGSETGGTATLVTRKRHRYPAVHVRYTDGGGVVRTVVKSPVSAGDEQLVRRPVRVVYHPKRTSRDDYVLIGFGSTPSRWFRGSFARPGS